MSSHNIFASILMACLLTVGFIGIAVANAASAGQSVVKPGESATNYVLESKHRGHRPRIHLPIGPASIYYEYLYSYCRGYYPTHIGGYVYYSSSHSYYPKYGGHCSKWYRKCPAKSSGVGKCL